MHLIIGTFFLTLFSSYLTLKINIFFILLTMMFFMFFMVCVIRHYFIKLSEKIDSNDDFSDKNKISAEEHPIIKSARSRLKE